MTTLTRFATLCSVDRLKYLEAYDIGKGGECSKRLKWAVMSFLSFKSPGPNEISSALSQWGLTGISSKMKFCGIPGLDPNN